MPRFSIGPIVGQYQPEDFTESQEAEYTEPKVFGYVVPPLIFKNWRPREVTLSFIVNALGRSLEDLAENGGIRNAQDQTDPEVVWATICAMMRPDFTENDERFPIPPVLGGDLAGHDFPVVTIPGWGVGNNTPRRAVIVSASIKRTHVMGDQSRAVRAIITVTLREYTAPTAQQRISARKEFLGSPR